MWDNLDGSEADKRRHERDSWMAQAGENAAAADRLARENDALKAENVRLRRERLPHMCRDRHPEIRTADNGEDERCPVCRERDRAVTAEAERDDLAGRLLDHAARIAEQAIEIDRLREALAAKPPAPPAALEDIFGDFDEADYKPDLASAVAAEVLGLPWTHGPATGDDGGAGEQMHRYGDVQEAVSRVLVAARTRTHQVHLGRGPQS